MSKALEALRRMFIASANMQSGYVFENQRIEDYDLLYKQLKALELIKKLPKEEKQTLLNAIYTYTKDDEKYELLEEVLDDE